MENELIEPEDAGYFTCCGDCYCNTENSNRTEADVDEDFSEMIAELSSLIKSIFGENVSFHFIVE